MSSLPTALSHPCYHDDEAARVTFESIRWPDGPYCPHCAQGAAGLGGAEAGRAAAIRAPTDLRCSATGEPGRRPQLSTATRGPQRCSAAIWQAMFRRRFTPLVAAP